MTKFASLVFILGLTFLLVVITSQLPIGHAPTIVGNGILSSSVNEVGAANMVTSVVLAYRGLDTLGELAILFTSATIVGLLLSSTGASSSRPSSRQRVEVNPSFMTTHALDLLYPLLLVVGFYIIFHGHLTPGGGFQGGVIIATAFFLDVLARPNEAMEVRNSSKSKLAWIESISGATFIMIGLFAMYSGTYSGTTFLKPFLAHGAFGDLWSAGTLPFLYIAVGLKVGAELSSLLLNLFYNHAEELS